MRRTIHVAVEADSAEDAKETAIVGIEAEGCTDCVINSVYGFKDNTLDFLETLDEAEDSMNYAFETLIHEAKRYSVASLGFTRRHHLTEIPSAANMDVLLLGGTLTILGLMLRRQLCEVSTFFDAQVGNTDLSAIKTRLITNQDHQWLVTLTCTG